MKKIGILICTLVIVIVAVIGVNIYSYNERLKAAEKNNKNYQSYYNVEVLGSDVGSLINKILDTNSKNNIQKDENGKYIDNGKEIAISVTIKFLELDKNISIEAIEKQGVDRFIKNFGAETFKCTEIEYYPNAKDVKSMHFEQVKK